MKYKKLIIRNVILSVLMLSLSTVSYAKETDELIQKKWVKNFGGSSSDYFNSVIKTRDGGVVAVGHSSSTNTGFVNNGNSDAVMVKYDGEGNQQWVKNFGGSGYDYFRSVIETQDESLVVVGYSNSTNAGFANVRDMDAIIVKYDSNGNQQWVKNLGGSTTDYFESVVETQDEGFIAVGYTKSTNAGIINKGFDDAIIVKYDKNGNERWIKGFGGYNNDYFHSVKKTQDGGVIAVGYSESMDAGFTNRGDIDAIMVKYDSNGNQQWVKNFGGSSYDYFRSVIITRSGDIITVGHSGSKNAGFSNKGASDAIIVKHDSNGNQQWVKNFGGSSHDMFYSLIETHDAGIIVVGNSMSNNAGFSNNGTDNAVIIKYNINGDQEWIEGFGGTGYDYFYSVVEVQDKSVIAVGHSDSYDSEFTNKGNDDAIIIKYKEKEKQKATSNIDVYIKPENILSLSLDTNSIIFEDFSGVDDMEKLNAINLTISSNLTYELNAYLATEIENTDKSKNMDKRILNIKESSESEYKTFTDINRKIVLKESMAGSDLKHSIDLKLKGGIIYETDIYKTTIKFEVQQK